VKLGRVGVIVAARTSSSRLPGKALLPLQGIPMIVFLIRRLSRLARGTVVLATTELSADDRLAELVSAETIPVFRGPDADVVARYVAAADHFGFDTVARVTGDCPFVDGDLVNWCLAQVESGDRFDLATTKGRFPVGLDVEIYPAHLMAQLHARGNLSASEREHLTLRLYARDAGFVVREIEPPSEWRRVDAKFTVDTQDDYEAAVQQVARFPSPAFRVTDLVANAA
jgi:spore coat polysaccharide biosynthesis protein SpsF